MARRAGLAAVIIVAAAMAGCGTQGPGAGSAQTAAPRGPKTVQATEADNGKTIVVAKNDAVKVTLPLSNGTEYGWQMVKSGDTLFEYETKLSPSAEERPGSPQTQVFAITTSQAGEIPLEFRYMSVYNKGAAPLKTISMKVKVTD
jgi:predicted secreted protein